VAGCVPGATVPVIRRVKIAQEVGADCVMVLAPHYYPNAEPDVVVDHFKAVADATDIPIMIYNNANVTGQDLSVNLLCRLAEIENIISLKDTTPNPGKLFETLYHLRNRFAIIPSLTRTIMPLDYRRGATGVITIFGNWDPAYALKIHDVATKGDIAESERMSQVSREFLNFIYAGDGAYLTSLGKEMCRIVGLDMGDHERLPLRRPSQALRDKLPALMQQAEMAYAPTRK
jgi:4-hydroxy-tetrahydrodipicolinate synthase